MKDRKDHWNQRYQENPFGKGKGPSAFIASMVDRLKKGKVLDVAMGEGQNAVYLAQKGFMVKGIDISEVGIEHAKKLAKDTGVEIDAQAVDLDLFIFKLFEYDSVLMTFFKPPMSRYYSELIRTLKQGGTLLIESHTLEEIKNKKDPSSANADYYFSANEVLRNLKGLRILYYNEAEVNGRHVVQCLAQKPLDKDAVKYGFDIAATQKEDPGSTAHHKLAESLFKKK